jgi:predicted small metal-binding protein
VKKSYETQDILTALISRLLPTEYEIRYMIYLYDITTKWYLKGNCAKAWSAMTSNICRDLGMECSFQDTGTTDNKIMREFIDHAASVHKMEVLSADIIFKVQNAIKK